jgi:hypothetical protein
MGERFLLLRPPGLDADHEASDALAHAGREPAMRRELAEIVLRLLGGALGKTPRARGDAETKRLIALATLVVRARSAVERDGYSREMELIPDPEAPTRIVIVLDRLLAGLEVIGLER